MGLHSGIPSRQEFDDLIGCLTPRPRDELVALSRTVDFDVPGLVGLFGQLFDSRHEQWCEAAATAAGQWLFNQQGFVRASELFQQLPHRRRPVKEFIKADRSKVAQAMAERALARVRLPSEEQVRRREDAERSHRWRKVRTEAEWSLWRKQQFELPAQIEHARGRLTWDITSDWLAFYHHVASAFQTYFWDDARREMLEALALDDALASLSVLHKTMSKVLDLSSAGVDVVESTRTSMAIADLAELEQDLIRRRHDKMPKFRNDASLPERLLLWNLRLGLRKAAKSDRSQASCLYELMHLEGVDGQWDMRTVAKHLANWKDAVPRHA